MVVLLTTNILNKRSIKCTGMFLLCDGHIHGRFVKLMLILIFMVDGYVRLGLTKQVSVQTRVGLIFKLAMVLKEEQRRTIGCCLTNMNNDFNAQDVNGMTQFDLASNWKII